MRAVTKRFYLVLASLFVMGATDFDCARDFAIEKVVDGVGGEEVLRSFTTVSYEGTGFYDPPNEVFIPGGEAPSLARSPFQLSAKQDLTNGLIRLDYEGRTFSLVDNIFQSSSEVIQENLGAFEGNSIFGFPLGAMSSDHVASTIKQQRLLFPHILLKEILENPALVTNFGTEVRNQIPYHFILIADEIHPIKLLLNPFTGRIERAETQENDQLLRDVKLEVVYQDWRSTQDGLLLPFDVKILLGNKVVREETRESIQSNEVFAADTFAFSEGIEPIFDTELADKGRRASQFHQMFDVLGFADGLVTTVVPIELSPGVFHLTGIAHHSLAIEQENGIVIVEAPVYPERSEAIIAWAQEQFPTKEITHVINTHHHMDHSAGLRTFVAQEATIIVGETVEDFFREDVFANSSEILPDFLSLNPGNVPSITTVPQEGSLTLPDPIRPITVFQIPNGHAADLTITYLPAQEILFNSDLFSPNTPFFSPLAISFAADLNNAIDNLGLAISSLVGGHGFGTNTLIEFRSTFGF